jgi:uncharacterized membrane protein YfcA
MLDVGWTALGGATAGCLGALLGIGGGVLLVPFLNIGLRLPVQSAFAVSLVTVIATSSVTSASRSRAGLVNLRLGMMLEIFTTVGGLTGILFVNHMSERMLVGTFAATLTGIAVVTLMRIDRRNVLRDTTIDVGLLGGRYRDVECGELVSYRVRHVPAALGASFVAGFVSNLGIGGGVLKVPVLNGWCGVPIRVAAATSALMIGATAVVGSVNYFIRGEIIPHLAAAAALGVIAGSRVGTAIAARSRAKHLKGLLVVILAGVALTYWIKVAG